MWDCFGCTRGDVEGSKGKTLEPPVYLEQSKNFWGEMVWHFQFRRLARSGVPTDRGSFDFWLSSPQLWVDFRLFFKAITLSFVLKGKQACTTYSPANQSGFRAWSYPSKGDVRLEPWQMFSCNNCQIRLVGNVFERVDDRARCEPPTQSVKPPCSLESRLSPGDLEMLVMGEPIGGDQPILLWFSARLRRELCVALWVL